MSDRPLHANEIGDNAKAYLEGRFRKERERIASQFDDVILRINKDIQAKGLEALNERLSLLERRVAAIWDLLGRTRPREMANPIPKVTRDSQGRIVDELLRDLIYARADAGLSKTQLARVLEVKTRTLNDWLNRKRAPKSAVTRNLIREWIDQAKNASGWQIRVWKGQE